MPQLLQTSGQTGDNQEQQKRQLAQLMMARAFQQPEVGPNTSPLAAILNPIMGAIMSKKMMGQADALQGQRQQTRQEDLAKAMSALEGTPEQRTQVPYVDDQAEFMGVPTPAGLGTMEKVTPAQPGSIQAMAKALMGARDPQMQMEGMRALTSSLKPVGQPASVQSYLFRETLKTPEEKAAFDAVHRAPTQFNLGNELLVNTPGGERRLTINPKPEQMPAFQGAQERAKAEQKAAVGMEEEFAKKGIKAQNMTDLINEARTNLTDASGGYVGTGVSAAKGALGISDKTTQANRKLKLISGWMVSNVPRMEGPQSDFDVKNYREMAATVGDSTIPINDRLAALDTLEKLQAKYAGNSPKPSGTQAGRLTPAEQSELEELRKALKR